MAGTPVMSATSVTGMPASAMAAAVPPLEISSTLELVQRPGQVDDAVLVVDGEQGSHRTLPRWRISRMVWT